MEGDLRSPRIMRNLFMALACAAILLAVVIYINSRGEAIIPIQSFSTPGVSILPPVPPPILTATVWEQVSAVWVQEFLRHIGDTQSWRTYTNTASGFRVKAPIEADITAPADCRGTEGIPGRGSCQDELVYQLGFQHYEEGKNELSMLLPPEYEKNAIAVFAMPKAAGDTPDIWASRYVQPLTSMEKKAVTLGAYNAIQLHITFDAGTCPSVTYAKENGTKTINIPCAGRNEATIFVINGRDTFIVGALSVPRANRSLYLDLYKRILATAEFL